MAHKFQCSFTPFTRSGGSVSLTVTHSGQKQAVSRAYGGACMPAPVPEGAHAPCAPPGCKDIKQSAVHTCPACTYGTCCAGVPPSSTSAEAKKALLQFLRSGHKGSAAAALKTNPEKARQLRERIEEASDVTFRDAGKKNIYGWEYVCSADA